MDKPVNKFQSTLPREERPRIHERKAPGLQFQSTLPREERPQLPGVLYRPSLHFNPRSHERSDANGGAVAGLPYVFQSTLPREERPFVMPPFLTVIDISIHAPTRGATEDSVKDHSTFLKFQSTLPREERQQYCTKNLFIFIQYRQ